jgi:hypothetical protein
VPRRELERPAKRGRPTVDSNDRLRGLSVLSVRTGVGAQPRSQAGPSGGLPDKETDHENAHAAQQACRVRQHRESHPPG